MPWFRRALELEGRDPDPDDRWARRRGITGRAAFFDVDKTLLPGSSMYLFARGLYRRGFYDLRDIAGFAFGQLVFRLTGAEGGGGWRRPGSRRSPSSRASGATT